MRELLAAIAVTALVAQPAFAGTKPTVKLEVENTYAKAEQLTVHIKKQAEPLKKCLKAALKSDSSFHGKWEYRAEIQASGATKITAITKSERVAADKFEECVMKVLGKVKFKAGHADTVPFALTFDVA